MTQKIIINPREIQPHKIKCIMKTLNFDKVENLNATDLLQVFNDLCENHNNYDDRIYSMDELDELYSSPWEAARAFYFGYRYNPYNSEAREQSSPCDEYFYYNGYGNICSIQEYDIAKYIASNLCNFDEDDIIAALSEYFDDEDYLDGTDEDEEEESC